MADTELAVDEAPGAQGARREPGARRLRDWVLVAQLPQPLPGGHPQDGPVVPSGGRDARDVGPGVGGARTRLDSRPGRRRRGHRAVRAVDIACGSWAASSARGFSSPGRWTPRRCCAHRAAADAGRCTIAMSPWTGRAGSPAWACSAPLRDPEFRKLWAAMCVSLLGDGAFLVAVAWQVYELSNTPTALSVVGIAMTVPTIVVPADRRSGERPLRPPQGDGGGGSAARRGRRGTRRAGAHPRHRGVADSRHRRGVRHGRGVLRPGVRRARPGRRAPRSGSRRRTRSTS